MEGSGPLIVTGMGRSGTSLAASLLQGAGVHMGERLMGAFAGNVKGHFEDLDFVEFHSAVLGDNQMHAAGWAMELPRISEGRRREAQRLVERKRREGVAWGWKDPRATLFLEFWRELMPGAHFVFMLRPPWEVVDSIFRRGGEEDRFSAREPKKLLAIWAFYNLRVREFVKAHPEQCTLVANDAMTEDPARFVAVVGQRAGLALGPPPALYEPGLMKGDAAAARAGLLAWLCRDEVELFLELNGMAHLPAVKYDAGWRSRQTAEACADVVFRDWYDARILQKDARKAAELSQERAELVARREELQAHATNLEQELRRVQGEAERMARESGEALAQREARVTELEKHAANLEAMLRETRQHAANLEAARDELKKHAGNLEQELQNWRGSKE